MELTSWVVLEFQPAQQASQNERLQLLQQLPAEEGRPQGLPPAGPSPVRLASQLSHSLAPPCHLDDCSTVNRHLCPSNEKKQSMSNKATVQSGKRTAERSRCFHKIQCMPDKQGSCHLSFFLLCQMK